MRTRPLIAVLLAGFPLLAVAQDAAAPAAPAPTPVAKAALVTGSVTVSALGGVRALGSGDAVNVGDTLTVGPNSYASLKFEDGGRILLRPETEFTVEAFHHKPVAASAADQAPASGSTVATAERALFRLARGGFRALSGLIKGNTETYRVATPSATIGIRGTDYEVQTCADDCPDVPSSAGLGPVMVAASDLSGIQLAAAQSGESKPVQIKIGVVVATNEGTVVLQTGKGEYLVKVGEVAFATANGQVFMLPEVPDILLYYSNESPEDCE